jgi:SAM-dependent methyltransferase
LVHGDHFSPAGTVTRDRDVQAFDERSVDYESGWRGQMHLDIAARTADLALALEKAPRRVLDVGCGTGVLLRLLAERLPDAEELAGIDAASGMVAVARSKSSDRRIHLTDGFAEHLPYQDNWFDLVVSTTSFDHWSDQRAGLSECARVLSPSGHFVLTDLFSLWLTPTIVFNHRDRARTKRRAGSLLKDVGFTSVGWSNLYSGIIAAGVASK